MALIMVALCLLTIYFTEQISIINSQTITEKRYKPKLVVQTGHLSAIRFLKFSPNGKFLISDAGNDLKLWDTATGKELRAFQSFYRDVDFSYDSQFLVTNSSLIDIVTGKQVKQFDASLSRSRHSILSEDNKIFIANDDEFAEIWSVETREKLNTIRGESLTISPGGKILASIGAIEKIGKQQEKEYEKILNANSRPAKLPKRKDNFIHILSLDTGKELQVLGGYITKPQQIIFSRDGKKLVSQDKSSIKVWDLTNGKLVKILNGNFNALRFIQLSHNANSIALQTNDQLKLGKKLQLWNVDSNKLSEVELELNKEFRGIDFGFDEKTFFLSNSD